MPKKTNAEKIEELEKKISMYEEALELAYKRNNELVEAEEQTFLHSPTYIQLKEHIRFIENVNKLNEYSVASTKKNAKQIDATIQRIYEDNKRLVENGTSEEYFVGITENWHEAWEFKKMQDQILELEAKVEQKEQTISFQNEEIHRLRVLLAENMIDKQQEMSEEKNVVCCAVPRKRSGR